MATNCRECKWAKDYNGSYCYCRKKLNRVLISKQIDCKKFLIGEKNG
jgi:hypothetical protein